MKGHYFMLEKDWNGKVILQS